MTDPVQGFHKMVREFDFAGRVKEESYFDPEGMRTLTLELWYPASGDAAGAGQELGATGERALLLYPPGLSFIAAFFGCLYAGVVAVPTYPPRRNRLDHRPITIATDAQAKFVLTTTQILSARAVAPWLESLQWLATDKQRPSRRMGRI